MRSWLMLGVVLALPLSPVIAHQAPSHLSKAKKTKEAAPQKTKATPPSSTQATSTPSTQATPTNATQVAASAPSGPTSPPVATPATPTGCPTSTQAAAPASREEAIARLQALIGKVNPAIQGKPKSAEDMKLAGSSMPPVNGKLVKGSYDVKSFTNSDDVVFECDVSTTTGVGTPIIPQSIATVHKLILKADGTGNIPFLATTVSFGFFAETFFFNNIPVVYSFDPYVNGVAQLSLLDFPFPGRQLDLIVIFKVRDGKVVGFDLLSNNDNPCGLDFFYLWFLGEGFKNSKAPKTNNNSSSSSSSSN